jgi:hypothetical protein
MTLYEFRRFFAGKVAKAGGVRAFARQHDVSPSHVSDVLNAADGREPGPTLLGIFRLKKTVRTTRNVTIERG